MADTLREIVNTDKSARMEVEKAKERRANLTAELALKKEEIDKQHDENAIHAVEKTRENAKKKIERLTNTIKEENSKKHSELLKKFDDNHETWEDAIYNAVIK